MSRVEVISTKSARTRNVTGVLVDGGMVNIRREGRRELKVGTTFDVEIRQERNPQTQELDGLAHGMNVHCIK